MKVTNIIIFLIFGICVANAQIAKKMELLSHWDPDTFPLVFAGQYSDCWGITTPNGKEYAVIGSTPYIHFFDISQDGNPVEVAHFAGGNVSLWREFKSYKSRIYAVADQGEEGLIIFDCSNAPTIVKTKQTTEFAKRTHMPFIDEPNGRLYLTGTNTQNGGMIVLDLTKDPDNPTLLASVPLPGGYVHDVFVKDNIAYCSHGNNGLWVYDFTNPQNPVLLGNMTNYPESGYNHSSWITKDNKYLVMADETHNTSVKVVDIQDLGDIKVIDLFKSALLAPANEASIAHNPYVRGNYSIISYYHDGVQVYDISNPLNVQNVAWYDTEPNNTDYAGFDGLWGVYPFFESDKLVLSDLNHGLFVVKLTDIDLESIHSGEVPEPVTNHQGVVTICAGSTVDLTVPPGAQFINWYKNGNMIQSSGNVLTVNETGVYKAVTWSHATVKESAEVKVLLSQLQSPVLTTENGATGFCKGEVLKLCSNTTAPKVLWTINGNPLVNSGDCYPADQAGIYQQIAIDGLCEKASNELSIEEYPLPSTIISPEIAKFCPGDSVTLSATTDAVDWVWFKDDVLIPGAKGNTYTAHLNGLYSAYIENEHCSTISDYAAVKVYDVIIPNILVAGDTLSVASGSAFQWFYNGNKIEKANTSSIVADSSGVYYVHVTDENGCITASASINHIFTSGKEPYSTVFRLYPNPVSGNLSINLGGNTEYTEWTILTLDGKMLAGGKLYSAFENNIPVQSLTSGMYLLQCKGESIRYMKFIKH